MKNHAVPIVCRLFVWNLLLCGLTNCSSEKVSTTRDTRYRESKDLKNFIEQTQEHCIRINDGRVYTKPGEDGYWLWGCHFDAQ